MPGGKVFVYTGMLKIANTDETLAAVLGHEIAHNVARHAAESMSNNIIITVPMMALAIFLDASGIMPIQIARWLGDILVGYVIHMPASRKHESEADYIGLLMMAKSCYDPQAAVTVWERMSADEKAQGRSIPQWLSTHPSSPNRVLQMQEWLPKAQDTRNASDCAAIIGYREAFGKIISGPWSS